MKDASVVLASLVFALSAFAEPRDWYVDDDCFGAVVTDGSAEHPYGTIQDAINAASSGDTILVAPGVYKEGGKRNDYIMNRVYLDKDVTIQATGTKEETHIVGRRDTTANGLGPNAVRCVAVDVGHSFTGAFVRGFTIRDGATTTDSAGSASAGGGFYGKGNATRAYLVDCVVSNCVARDGGGVYGGVAIRTQIADCTCSNMGGAGRSAGFWNCLITENNGNATTLETCYCVNCTIFGNNGVSYAANSGVYRNCIVVANKNTDGASNVTDTKGCVFSTGAVPACEGAFVGASPYQILAPAFGDVRVIRGSVAETAGRVSYMDISNINMPADEKYYDFRHQKIPEDAETIMAGCLQVSVAPAAGRIDFITAGIHRVCGIPEKTGLLWCYPETYPTQIHYRADATTAPVYCYGYGSGENSADSQSRAWRAPEFADDSLYVVPPPEVTGVATVKTFTASNVLYVDPENGVDSDETGRGLSSDAPYKTLQKAVDKSPVGQRTIIYAAKGDYDARQGSRVQNSRNVRVAISSNAQYVRIKGAGAGQSVIVGAAATVPYSGTDTFVPVGCGEDSVGGVFSLSSSIIQGFTFRDCYGTQVNGGAAVSANTGSPVVSDCTITNCCARDGAGGTGSIRFERCRFYDGIGGNGYFRGVSGYASCLAVGCNGKQGIFYNDGAKLGLYNCTCVYTNTSSELINAGFPVVNTIGVGGSTAPAATSVGSIYWKYRSSYGGAPAMDPQFAGEDSYRLRADSQALAAGATPTASGNWWYYATSDLEGNPLLFVDGKVVPGCYHRTASVVTVAVPKYGTAEPSGTSYLEPGESLTVTYENGTPARPFVGFSVNGGDVVSPDTSLTIRYPSDADGSVYGVVPVCGTNWYVNANREGASGDGFTPETAKKTLREVFEDCPLLSGDVVHAARGDYKDETMDLATPYGSGSEGLTPNRVVVSEGVTLVADEGRDVTFIRGQAATSGGDEYGRGPGAVRSVFLENKARLIGFTVVDGTVATPCTGTIPADNDDSSGGGILCRTAAGLNAPMVEDCVITNCAGVRGGGALGGTFVNCVFVGNKGRMGSAARDVSLFGCIIRDSVPTIGDSRGDPGVEAPKRIEGCTFGPGEKMYEYTAAPLTLVNSVFLDTNGGIQPYTNKPLVASNCFFAVGAIRSGSEGMITLVGGGIREPDELRFDCEMRPVYGACAAINGGSNAIQPPELAGKTDALGGQRIYHATIDSGAVEFDYRPVFAAALGTGVTVGFASPEVIWSDGALRLTDGLALTANWTVAPGKRVAARAQVTGAGTLAVGLNGLPLAELTETSMVAELRFRSTGDNALAFAFAGEGTCAIYPFKGPQGVLLIVR